MMSFCGSRHRTGTGHTAQQSLQQGRLWSTTEGSHVVANFGQPWTHILRHAGGMLRT